MSPTIHIIGVIAITAASAALISSMMDHPAPAASTPTTIVTEQHPTPIKVSPESKAMKVLSFKQSVEKEKAKEKSNKEDEIIMKEIVVTATVILPGSETVEDLNALGAKENAKIKKRNEIQKDLQEKEDAFFRQNPNYPR